VGRGRFIAGRPGKAIRVDLFERSRRRGPRRGRSALVIAAALVVVLVNVVAVRDLVSTHRDTAHVRRAQVDAVRKTASHQGQTTSVAESVDATGAELGVRAAERDQLRASVGSTISELGAARDDLGAAIGRVAMQVGQITTLTTCLQGVSKAMNGLSVGDGARGLGALRAVAGPCQTSATIGTGP
jgi:hypothetical protein